MVCQTFNSGSAPSGSSYCENFALLYIDLKFQPFFNFCFQFFVKKDVFAQEFHNARGSDGLPAADMMFFTILIFVCSTCFIWNVEFKDFVWRKMKLGKYFQCCRSNMVAPMV